MSKHVQSITSGLNLEQTQAVTLDVNAGAVLVLAGAGTGKTSVLTRRIAWLVHHGAPPGNILAVTFTNKAAREMKERLVKLGVDPFPLVGTFHSIGLRILKLCPEAAGVTKGFTVMDENDKNSLWNRLFVQPKVIKNDWVRPDHGLALIPRDDEMLPVYRERMFRLKEMGARNSTDCQRLATDQKLSDPWLFQALDIYEAARKQQNLLDFDDLIAGSLVALRNYPAGRAFAERFSHVLVDEFQDTSLSQYDWVRAIANPMSVKNLFCVGDDYQSIYSFRGAVIENVWRFVREYNAQEVLLERNYRCASSILAAANSLIANNAGGTRKRLWTDSNDGLISFRRFPTDKEEAYWIASSVQASRAFERTAVLLRTRAAMLPVANALRTLGVPYQIVGGKDFFERREIRDALALIQLYLNNMNMAAFVRVAGMLEGVGETSISRVTRRAELTGQSALEASSSSSNKALAGLPFVLRQRPGASCKRVVAELISESGLGADVLNDDDKTRVQNIAEFIDLSEGYGTVEEFSEEMTLFTEKDKSVNGVTISTVHAAKGLEWENVFIPALSENHFPAAFRFDENDPPTVEKLKFHMEEERRLMYVALTRGKRDVVVSFSRQRLLFGKVIYCNESPFVREAMLKQDTRSHA
ncbi:ATP-dependent helicase [Ferrovum sp.]|uniref:ATP-dependent helicase n=1 Tax=Ferrovum sp. TaxID=2609467 RepID=UPI002631DD15|nr:ATP-dependent helicase [Ferrovum sp.]